MVAEEFARENLRRLRLAAPTIVLLNPMVFLMAVLTDVAADAQQAGWSPAVLLCELFAGTGYLKTALCWKSMWCDAAQLFRALLPVAQ
ncbi:MAG: hypothetical protein PHS32_02575 [Rhodoferax sp.]|uniref:hypothetical protein n=1 Tax=Rhodoferax sp. TaxID=50421 RepID=UPI002603838F|nr:hypothetical protein [Rhodoferax sp.]MDD5332606.1 hypothetical protein [Rhodoferax sp.]